MWTLFKFLLLTAVALVVLPVGYFLGPFLTETTAGNVEGRIERLCTAGVIIRSWEQRMYPSRTGPAMDFADCDCVARESVKSLTAPTAAQFVESARLVFIDHFTSQGKADPDWKRLQTRNVELIARVLETTLRQCRTQPAKT